MSRADNWTPRIHRIASALRALLVPIALIGCTSETEQLGDAPFLVPSGGDADEAPFRGPAEKLPAAQEHPEAQPEVLPDPVEGPAEIAVSGPPTSGPHPHPPVTAAQHRRSAWLNSSFRCKAISTTRLRRCKFEGTPDGYRLRFPVADVVCEDVSFDENGDPERLTGCKGAWLLVPKSSRLRPNKAREVWSGSHSGWRWKGDRQRYCCPGLWLEEPNELQI